MRIQDPKFLNLLLTEEVLMEGTSRKRRSRKYECTERFPGSENLWRFRSLNVKKQVSMETLLYLRRWNTPFEPFSKTSFSVTMAEMRSAGVTSNAGFQTSIPSSEIWSVSIVFVVLLLPRICCTSAAARSSMTISAPVARERSILQASR